MPIYIDFLIPGSHLHKRNKKLLGDVANVFASLCLVSGIFLMYSGESHVCEISFFFLFLMLTINIWQIISFNRLILDPAILNFQEHEFREIISSFLKDDTQDAFNRLNKLIQPPHQSYEMEILMVQVLYRQSKYKEAKKMLSYLQEKTLSEPTKSLLYSVSKQLKNN